jgi:hypothetical protein
MQPAPFAGDESFVDERCVFRIRPSDPDLSGDDRHIDDASEVHTERVIRQQLRVRLIGECVRPLQGRRRHRERVD